MKIAATYRAALAAACVALTAFTAASPAAAATPPAGQQELADSYLSLSGAFITLYAAQEGVTVEKYLEEQQTLLGLPLPQLPPLPAAADTATQGPDGDPDRPTGTGQPAPSTTLDPGGAPTRPAMPPAATDPATPLPGTGEVVPDPAQSLAGLNEKLAQSGIALDTSGYTSLQALADDVVAKAGTLDGAVTIASAKWMSDLAGLRAPKLTAPAAGKVTAPGVPQSALLFGLLGDKALSALVTNQPDLFTAAGRAGVGNAAAGAAWSNALLEAFNGSQQSLEQALPDPCTGAMLSVMATGNPTAGAKYGACDSSCVTGGLYLNNQTLSLFSEPASKTLPNPFSNVWNSSTVSGLQDWQQQLLLQQNPSLMGQLSAGNDTSASRTCTQAGQSATNTLTSTLPGIFGQLQTK